LEEPSRLEVGKEEGFVLLEGTSQAESSAVVPNSRARHKLAGWQSGHRVRNRRVVVIPGVRVESGVLHIPVHVAMELIGTGAAERGDLAASGAAKRGIRVGNTNPKFRDGVHVDGNDGNWAVRHG